MLPLVIAHRGYSARAPENTLAAFRLGWESGADGVECDVHLTADGKVVCIHDYTTDRVSSEALVVAKATWAQLSSLEAGAWKGPEWAGEPLPRLTDLLAELPDDSLAVIELKCGPEIVAPLLKALEAVQADRSRMLIISFEKDSLVELKRVAPDLKAYWLSDLERQPDGSYAPSVSEILATIKELGVDGFGGESGPGITAHLAEALGKSGFELNVWTVDDPEEARRMRAIGVTSVTTNDPKRILQALHEG